MQHPDSGRIRLDMNADWRFQLGDIAPPYETRHGHVYGVAKAGGARGAARSDWDDSAWERVDLPHDWCANLAYDPEARPPHGYKRRGIGWYRKRFRIDESHRGRQLVLQFDGISTHATVYLNGSVLKRNWCGYTAFHIDIGDMAFFGDKPNTIAIRVDAEDWEGWWYEGAGIYRHVTLVVAPSLHIALNGIWVNPFQRSDSEWETRIETIIESNLDVEADFDLVSDILDSHGIRKGRLLTTHRCGAHQKIQVEQTIPIRSPLLWDIDSPELHTLVSRVCSPSIEPDEERTIFGYRTIRIDSMTGFHLNGRRLVLKGTCNHQDHAGIGTALPDNIHAFRIGRLKEMGSNAYRCAHNPPAPEFLEACDRLGMLVMDENRNFDSSPEGLEQLRSMVLQGRNHPSVVMYSLCNEEPLQGTESGCSMASRMYREVKILDHTRPILTAMNGGIFEEDGMATVCDITGLNYMLEQLDRFHEKHPTQPMIASENCCVYSTRGEYRTDQNRRVFACFDDEKAPWGESIRASWKAVLERDFVMGMFLWTGFDYRGEPSPYEWPAVSSQFGAMDTCGFAKDSFHLLQALWTDQPVMHVAPPWKGFEIGERVRVMTLTNGDEVELVLNGKSLGRRASDPLQQLEWHVPFDSGVLQAIAYRNGRVWAKCVDKGSGEPVSIRLERVTPERYGERSNSEIVNVAIEDDEHRIVTDAIHTIRFSVEGAGCILGVGNGDPTCHEPDAADTCIAFHGLCQVIIRRLSEGEVHLDAMADGLRAASLEIAPTPLKSMQSVPSIHDRFIENWRMCQKVFSERPDSEAVVEETDMNSWETIQLGYGPQRLLDAASGYALYRSEVQLLPEERAQVLFMRFHDILGYVEIFANGKRIADEDHRWGGPLDVLIPEGLGNRLSLVVILRCTDTGPQSGICGSITMQHSPDHITNMDM